MGTTNELMKILLFDNGKMSTTLQSPVISGSVIIICGCSPVRSKGGSMIGFRTETLERRV